MANLVNQDYYKWVNRADKGVDSGIVASIRNNTSIAKKQDKKNIGIDIAADHQTRCAI